MNPDEVDIGVRLVRRLIGRQFPRWAALPVTKVRSAGTDNAIFRLGADMAVRLPRRPGAAADVARQYEWLPRLARLLPLAGPDPIARSQPANAHDSISASSSWFLRTAAKRSPRLGFW